MDKFIALFSLSLLIFASSLFAQIPDSATILETANVTPKRQLILWMQGPEKHPRDREDDLYSCPDATRGHYYTGIANVSLVNRKTKKLINTIEIEGSGAADDNKIDLPYLIKRGYYRVSKLDENKEGKPILMDLKDINNDGKPYEFALFDALACMGLQTALIGYSEKQDKVIQYQSELKRPEGTARQAWVDYFFTHKPDGDGKWRYQIDYRGRGGTLDKYEIRYDKDKEMFFGEMVSIGDEIGIEALSK